MLETLKRNESFSYKKLSKEEMEARGILGRLVGPCADFTIPTRNGRKYNESLWNNVFEDEIVLEKINNKCLFGELGHPLDREEVDPEKIAIALNEKPIKNADGQLVACFDILNTPSGKILKTLCDYGTTIGISSRGSGDIIEELGEEIVDPDTYMFECFDAVILPAVKAARLKYMTESLSVKEKKLRRALRESIENAPEEEKEIMKNTLEELDLDISLDEETNLEDEAIEIVPKSRQEQKVEVELNEDVEDEAVEETEDKNVDVENTEEESVEDIEEIEESDEEVEATYSETVEDFIKNFEDYDKDLKIEFKPIVIDGVEYGISSFNFDDSEGKLVVSIDYTLPEMEDDNKLPEEENPEVEEVSEDEAEIEISKDDEAEDNGEENSEIFESLKDLIRQKDLLEQELKDLKSSKTVEDSKVRELTEELNKYKDAFARTSKIAARVRVAEAQVKSLNEQLVQKDDDINKLKSVNTSKLNEGINVEKQKVAALKEQLEVAQTKNDDLNKKLTSAASEYENKLAESVKVAKAYKAKCSKMLEQYISFRASQLGVRSSEIINRLGDKTSFEQINEVCDKILTENVSYTRSYSIDKNSKVVIKEQKENHKSDDYDWDSLYELAGLTK